MADYSMDDEAWNKRVSKINTYLDANDLGEMAAVIQWNINEGTKDTSNRKRFWTSITTLFGMLPDSPISRGRESDLPENVQQAITAMSVTYAEAYCAAFATDPLFGEIVRKHGKSGGGVYETVDEYAASLKSSMKSRLTGYYRNHLKGVSGPQWDGSVENGIPAITVVEADSSTEEEE
tara:strand:- start:2433 stop:2966 length:534 start_codon:yes stop_codon:yes gene_type:complete